jgi:hypothetical protein
MAGGRAFGRHGLQLFTTNIETPIFSQQAQSSWCILAEFNPYLNPNEFNTRNL